MVLTVLGEGPSSVLCQFYNGKSFSILTTAQFSQMSHES